jgi:hypothetical protein
MKNLITGLAFLIMLSLFSCTKTIYTAQQNMQRYRTKQDIVNNFGLPAEKRSGEGIEEWLYNYGAVNVATGYRNTNATVNGDYNSAYGNSNTLSVTQFSQYNRYIKFTLNDRGNVIKWESQGVDLAVKQKAPGKTIAALSILLALTVGLAIAGSSGGGN